MPRFPVFYIICDMIVDIAIVACSTIAAIHFGKWWIMFFMLLVLISGHSWKYNKEG